METPFANAQLANFLIGLLAVVWLASRRFNTPRPVRTYTNATRYLWGCVAYVTAGVVLYTAVQFLVCQTGFADYAALAAIAVLGFAVRLPGLSRLDRRVRESLHRAIGYPTEAHRLAAALAVAPFAPDPAVREEVRFVLQGRGYELDDAWLPVAEPVRELWFRTAALFQQVRGWDRDALFGSFAWAAHDEFEVLRQRFDQMSLKVVRVLETIEQLGRLWVCAAERAESPECPRPEPSDPMHQRFQADLRAIISRLLADLRQDLAFFNHNLCLFAARGILTECVWARGRQRQLAKLGFELPPEPSSVTAVLALTFVFILGVFVAFAAAGGLTEAELMRSTRIAIVQVLAVAIVVIPKRHFGFANEDLRGGTPWGFVLGAGLAAVLVAGTLMLGFARFTGLPVSPFGLVMPFAMAAALALLVQDGRWAWIESPIRRRLADVLVLLGALAVGLCVARGLHYLLAEFPFRITGRQVLLIAILAAGIGYTIPTGFRRPVREREPGSQAAAPAPSTQAGPSRAPLEAPT